MRGEGIRFPKRIDPQPEEGACCKERRKGRAGGAQLRHPEGEACRRAAAVVSQAAPCGSKVGRPFRTSKTGDRGCHHSHRSAAVRPSRPLRRGSTTATAKRPQYRCPPHSGPPPALPAPPPLRRTRRQQGCKTPPAVDRVSEGAPPSTTARAAANPPPPRLPTYQAGAPDAAAVALRPPTRASPRPQQWHPAAATRMPPPPPLRWVRRAGHKRVWRKRGGGRMSCLKRRQPRPPLHQREAGG